MRRLIVNSNIPRFAFALFWVMLCSVILWRFIKHPMVWSDPEITVLYILTMLTITFPIGIAYWTALSVLALITPNPNLPREVELVLVWLGFVIFGYMQWAVFLPWCYGKLKKRVLGSENSSSERDAKQGKQGLE